MEELLNKYGLPNDFGFAISFKMFSQFFNSEKDYLNFSKEVNERIRHIKDNYGISDSINFNIEMGLALQSQNGSKRIILDKKVLFNSIFDYFTNTPVTLLSSNEYLFFDEIKEKEWLDNEIKLTRDLLSNNIKKLNNVKKIDELKEISFLLYKAYLQAYNEIPDNKSFLIPFDQWFHDELKNDINTFKRIKIWLPQLIDDLTKKTISNDLFKNINIDKFKLFLIHQYFEIARHFNEPYRSLLIHSSIEIFNSIDNKDVSLEKLIYLGFHDNKEFKWYNGGYVNYTDIEKVIKNYLANPLGSTIFNTINSYKIDNEDNDYNKVYSNLKSLINMAITKSNELGQQDVSLKDINNEAKEKLKIEKSIEKQNQLKSFIDRSEFYLNEPNIFKVQKGNGIFKNSYIIYFDNGAVAIDKLNGEYGYLYLMPINTYFELINNNSIKNLIEMRSIITVTPISHKKINWKEFAHNEIQKYSIKPHELEMLNSINGISLPVNDKEIEKAKQKYKNNEYIYKKIIEKEEERKNKYKEIDSELKKENYEEYDEKQEKIEEDLVLDAEDEINENISNPSDLISIFDYENKIKTKRNAKVSLETKLRTMDENMAIKCEMCGDESLDTRSFDSHHIIPLSKGGIDNVYNTVCLCGKCHKKIHGKIPFTYEQKWKMLMNVRKNIEKSTPFYLKNFDRLFNPNYNAIYNNNLSEEEQLKKYEEEQKYYLEHKTEEDEKFLTEYNHFKK